MTLATFYWLNKYDITKSPDLEKSARTKDADDTVGDSWYLSYWGRDDDRKQVKNAKKFLFRSSHRRHHQGRKVRVPPTEQQILG